MSTLAGDFWVCGECRSINNAGARQCYNCRTPRDRAAVDPSTIDPANPGKLRKIELPGFESSRWAAVLASILIVAVAVLQVVQFNLVTALLNQTLGGIDPTSEQLQYVASVVFVAFGIALLALIAWSLWLSRTVTAMPALGLGYPPTNGMMAFVENFIPVLNLFRVPAIVRDVVRRLEPSAGRGEALIFAAWISLLGGYLVPRVLGLFSSDPRTAITVSGIGTGLVLVGAIFLIVLIWWIERRIGARRDVQLAELRETPADAVGAPRTSSTTDAVQTRSAFAAAGPAVVPAAADDVAPPVPQSGPDAQPEPVGPPEQSAPVEATLPDPQPAIAAEPESIAEPGTATEATTQAVAELASEPERFAEPDRAAEPEPTVAPEPAAEPETLGPEPAEPEPTPEQPPAAAAAPPHLVIRVSGRGLMTAEMDGETEPVILEDLGTYAAALAEAGGRATIAATSADGMAGLIVRRAQRILEDAGVQITID